MTARVMLRESPLHYHAHPTGFQQRVGQGANAGGVCQSYSGVTHWFGESRAVISTPRKRSCRQARLSPGHNGSLQRVDDFGS
jgi:hypothetical protein